MRDRFHNQIVQGLEGPLDPELFERCATDLLREVFPGLVPITGGSDAGMDGAISDGMAEPFPLVATTGKKVIGNLTRSLESYLHDGGTRRKVVVATSQKLTPPKRRNLHKRASDLGFELVGIFAQDAFADLLYRSRRWCMELLNLPGTPPALSALPKTSRPQMNDSLVGRDKDLTWLESTSDDRLLVGQPGVGKTFLLREFVKRGGGLFVVTDDRAAVLGDLREERPKAVIVDDADAPPDLVQYLRQVRAETGANFSIIVSCWPGDEGSIADGLNLPRSKIHHLDLLTMDEMVEVIEGTGLVGPPELIQEIVGQAEGRPGLAVTLVDLCRKGAIEEIVRGEALSRSVLTTFGKLIGSRARDVLAVLALGGEAGLPMEIAAAELQMPLVDLRQVLVRLAAGGVVVDAGRQLLSVRPPALRHALVRDGFFGGATSLPGLERIFGSAPSPADVALTLIGASARGWAIPDNVLQRMVENVDSQEVWMRYAGLGADQAIWVVRKRPEMLLVAAGALLHHAPETVVPLLLDRAEGDSRQLHSTPEHPVRLIQDWVQSGRPGTGKPVRRRKIVLESLQHHPLLGRDTGVTARGIQIVMSPGFHEARSEPGSGKTVTLHYGYISLDEMKALRAMWPEIRDMLKTLPTEQWAPVREMVEDWAYSGRMNVQVPMEMHEFMREFGEEMVLDMLAQGQGRPSVAAWASRLARDLGIEGIPSPDAEFSALFPERDFTNAEQWREAESKQVILVKDMALEWSLRDPAEVANRLVYLEEEARLASLGWPRWTPLLCAEIAKHSASPLTWVRAFIGLNAPSDLVAPFLTAAHARCEAGWAELMADCLSSPSYRWAALPLALSIEDAPDWILERALNSLSGAGEAIKTLCLRGEVPVQTLTQLLKHDDPKIAAAAAYGEWNADPKSTVRPVLLEEWREAVRKAPEDDDYWLREVFAIDPALAYEWLRRRLSSRDDYLYRQERGVTAAIGVLNLDQRRSLLNQLDKQSMSSYEMVFRLVGNNVELYRELLALQDRSEWHLVPLSGDPAGAWLDKAKLALDAGYGPDVIARAAYGHPGMTFEWVGKESAKWAEWASKFDALSAHDDQRIRGVGQAGKEIAAQRIKGALEEERDEEIYGIGWRRRHL